MSIEIKSLPFASSSWQVPSGTLYGFVTAVTKSQTFLIFEAGLETIPVGDGVPLGKDIAGKTIVSGGGITVLVVIGE